MSLSEFSVILILCFMGYGLYLIVKTNNKRKIQRENEIQESLANISDKNLAIVMKYIYERQKQDSYMIMILTFICILILSHYR